MRVKSPKKVSLGRILYKALSVSIRMRSCFLPTLLILTSLADKTIISVCIQMYLQAQAPWLFSYLR